jgi:hypothetical protein
MRISRAQDFPFNAVPATTWRTYLQYFAGALTVKTASLRLLDMVNAHGTEGKHTLQSNGVAALSLC